MNEEVKSSYSQSESIASFIPAFLECQKKWEKLEKNKTNDYHHNDYADLAQVLNVVRPVLNEHDIIIMSFPCYGAEKIGIETRLIHVSGEWISNTVYGPLPKWDPQGIGIAMTYFRRYGLTALTGLAQEDKDGNMDDRPPQQRQNHKNNNQQKAAAPSKPPATKQPISIEQTIQPIIVEMTKIKDQNQFVWYMKRELPRKKLSDEVKKVLFPSCLKHGEKLGLVYVKENQTWIRKEPTEASTH